jgi:signal transduction histidine kinase
MPAGDPAGSATDHAAGWSGLAGIRDRIAAVGGTVDIESGPSGTRLCVDVPLAAVPNAVWPVQDRTADD